MDFKQLFTDLANKPVDDQLKRDVDEVNLEEQAEIVSQITDMVDSELMGILRKQAQSVQAEDATTMLGAAWVGVTFAALRGVAERELASSKNTMKIPSDIFAARAMQVSLRGQICLPPLMDSNMDPELVARYLSANTESLVTLDMFLPYLAAAKTGEIEGHEDFILAYVRLREDLFDLEIEMLRASTLEEVGDYRDSSVMTVNAFLKNQMPFVKRAQKWFAQAEKENPNPEGGVSGDLIMMRRESKGTKAAVMERMKPLIIEVELEIRKLEEEGVEPVMPSKAQKEKFRKAIAGMQDDPILKDIAIGAFVEAPVNIMNVVLTHFGVNDGTL